MKSTWHSAAAAVLSLVCVSTCANLALAAINVGGDPGEVTPSDPSTWTNSVYSRIGNGKTGTLTVDGGSDLFSATCDIALGSSSSGTVVVTGSGSTWTNGGRLIVGYSGSGVLRVENGGLVSDGDCALGLNSHGIAIVSGSGSAWIHRSDLDVGDGGAGILMVADGGLVSNVDACIGSRSGSSGVATVSGTGSTWTSSGDLYVGDSYDHRGLVGTGALMVENGGTVNARTLWAAGSDLKGNGTINVSGLVSDIDMVFDAAHGANCAVAFGTGGTLNLRMDGTGHLGAGNRGTASISIADGVTVASDCSYLGCWSGSSGTASVTGIDSAWTNSGFLMVGDAGAGTLTIEHGGKVTNTDGYLGYYSGSSGSVAVAGAGSVWANSSNLYIGYMGCGTLRISDGGQVACLNSDLGGVWAAGDATVTGPGSLWNSGSLTAGTASLAITDGGTVNCYLSRLGMYLGSISTACVRGEGSIWTNTLSLDVGYSGTAMLTVENGGKVSSANGSLGFNASAKGTAIVTGQGSSWINREYLVVGRYGTAALRVENGGVVTNTQAYIGSISGSFGVVTVTGAGSTWTNSEDLYVGGYMGSFGTGTLRVENGGTVNARTLWVAGDLLGDGTINVKGLVADISAAFDRSAKNVTFGDGGTISIIFDGSGHLGAGYRGTASISIMDGAEVATDDGYLGYYPGSSGTVTVTGEGSAWSNASYLYVGKQGTGTLRIADGGRVTSSHTGALGYWSGSSGTVTVTGTTAVWTAGAYLDVGKLGTGMLTVTDGGTVTGTSARLGLEGGGTGTARVTGQGSTLACTSVIVGGRGTGTLRIESGGKVTTLGACLGDSQRSSGTAIITGAHSTLVCVSLQIGMDGTGTLTVADSAMITTRSVNINSLSALNLRVSNDGQLVLGDASAAGIAWHYGQVNFYADAFLAAGTYRPITEYAGRAITWSGSGSYNATGGAWDPAAKTFIVQPAVQVAGGVVTAVAEGQRLLVTDASSGKRVGASFPAVPAVPAGTTFRADAMGDEELSGLSLGSGEYILAAWAFDTNFTGSAMLAFDVGIVPRPTVTAGDASAGMDGLTGGLKTYRLDGSSWALLPTGDLLYAETGIASFTTGVFGGFAITAVSAAGDADRDGQIDDDDLSLLLSNWNQPAGWTAGNFSDDGTVDDDDLSLLLSNWTGGPAPAVPEPATLAILALGVVGMLRRRPRASSGNR